MNIKQTLTFVLQSVVIGLAAAAIVLLLIPGSFLTNSARQVDSYHAAIEAAAPAVVNIYSGNSYTEHRNPILQDPLFRRFFGESSEDKSSSSNTRKRIDSKGSGVIMDAQGHILTNAHVIQDAEEIFVVLRDGRETIAKVIGVDSDTDLAVLQIDLNNLPVIPIGDSNQLHVGDIVLAIDNPYDVGQAVTQGRISATGRKRLGISSFDNFIQTDADINPG
ncbi:MAG: transcriptional regulator, partial [Gammaproteobacteria bacterium]